MANPVGAKCLLFTPGTICVLILHQVLGALAYLVRHRQAKHVVAENHFCQEVDIACCDGQAAAIPKDFTNLLASIP